MKYKVAAERVLEAAVKHVVMTNPERHGFEYGVLEDFESEICRVTGATMEAVPPWGRRLPKPLLKRMGHGMRLSPLREVLPKESGLSVRADVAWAVLMGPQDTDLDRFRGWDDAVGFRILYLFDTFPQHLEVTRRVLRAAKWDLAITSFHAAVPWLERETARKWHAVCQGVVADRFKPVEAAKRSIGISAYGRRLGPVHTATVAWSKDSGVHYDVSTAAAPRRDVSNQELYSQHAWHLRQSWFNYCWPVEVTHPDRAGSLSPVTCRWFEAAASGVVMLGRAPGDPIFEEMFGSNAVLPVDPAGSPRDIQTALATYWQARDDLVEVALRLREERLHLWTWESRVREILALARLPTT